MNKVRALIISTAISLIIATSAIADEPGVGDIAPEFEITQMDGTNFKLSDYKGKQSVYLVFWNTWCTFCMKKIPKLKAAHQQLPDDIKIIAVNTTNKDSVEESIEFQKRFNITYPLAFDHGKIVTDLYNVWGTPTEFIIDINGVIQHRDGVPEKLEDNLDEWNTVMTKFKDSLFSYYNNTVGFFSMFNQSC